MTKVGKLGKLLKKMQSMGRTSSFNRENDHNHHQLNTSVISRRNSTSSSSSTIVSSKYTNIISYDDDDSLTNNNNVCPVYVGKSRRRYMVSSEVLAHPLFRELVDRAPVSGGEEICVGCEVVLFEHLLWMLQNADPQPESLDELVDFYAC